MSNGTDLATSALEHLVGVLGEDAFFVIASRPRELREALDGLAQRRARSYTAAVQGQPHTRMTTELGPWIIEMARAMAPVWPTSLLPMMDVVREKVTLEIGARGLRSLFSSKPSDKDVARVKRYGALAVRTLRAVYASDGPLDTEDRTAIDALIAALGLPDTDATTLHAEAPVAAETLEVYGEMDDAIVRGLLRGAWLAAAWDGVDPREEAVVAVVARKLGVDDEVREATRRDAIAQVEALGKAGTAAVDAVRYMLSDRAPGIGVQLPARVAMLMVPRRLRQDVLAAVGTGAPAPLAKRHHGLDTEGRRAVLGVAWAAALVDNPTEGRRALLRARWERVATDLGEDDPAPREDLERWAGEALAGVARTLA
jgi:hypothetical protein